MGYVRLMDYTAHEPSRQSPAKLPPSAPSSRHGHHRRSLPVRSACIRTIVCEWVILSVSRTWEVPTPGNRDSGTPPNTGLTGTRSKGLTCPTCSATWLGVTLLGTVAVGQSSHGLRSRMVNELVGEVVIVLDTRTQLSVDRSMSLLVHRVVVGLDFGQHEAKARRFRANSHSSRPVYCVTDVRRPQS
ncbi:hypothetical protein B0T13DRAFT_21746 [Neurospora crassa]|nr:hypothetical protein B0T13DRAFT_21746 [Neurospora crassa]